MGLGAPYIALSPFLSLLNTNPYKKNLNKLGAKAIKKSYINNINSDVKHNSASRMMCVK